MQYKKLSLKNFIRIFKLLNHHLPKLPFEDTNLSRYEMQLGWLLLRCSDRYREAYFKFIEEQSKLDEYEADEHNIEFQIKWRISHPLSPDVLLIPKHFNLKPPKQYLLDSIEDAFRISMLEELKVIRMGGLKLHYVFTYAGFDGAGKSTPSNLVESATFRMGDFRKKILERVLVYYLREIFKLKVADVDELCGKLLGGPNAEESTYLDNKAVLDKKKTFKKHVNLFPEVLDRLSAG